MVTQVEKLYEDVFFYDNEMKGEREEKEEMRERDERRERERREREYLLEDS